MQLYADSDDAVDFERSTHRTFNNLNLTPLIDVLFILIIFFMLTTSFMKIESLELILPSATAAAPKTSTSNDVVRIFIHSDGEMTLGKRKVSAETLNASLSRMFEKDDTTKVMLLTADGVTMQQLVNIMDRIYLAGGKSLYVRKWQDAGAGSR
ncbi:MAG: ExbD/TolR family protein [Alphaproteobacteria bacterium]